MRHSCVLTALAVALTAAAPALSKEIRPDPNGITLNKGVIERLFDNRLIVPNEVHFPAQLVESLLVIDSDSPDRWYWTKVDPSRKDPEPEMTGDIVFQSVVDWNVAARVGYLSFLSAAMTNEDKTEVVVTDVYHAREAPWPSGSPLDAAAERARQLAKPGRTFYYVTSVQYTTIQYRVFKKRERGATFEGFGFGAQGKVYSSNLNYEVRKVVSVNVFPVSAESGTKALSLPPAPRGRVTPAIYRLPE